MFVFFLFLFFYRIINRTNAREAAAKLYRDIHKEFLDQALQNLNLIHMNHILYKCVSYLLLFYYLIYYNFDIKISIFIIFFF